MSQIVFKAGLILSIVGFATQEADAFGRCGCGRGGYGGYGYGGYGGWGYAGYGGWGYAGYGGWYGGYGYGYPGWGYGGFGAYSNNGYVSRVARTNAPTQSSSQPASDSIRLTVDVPANAKVTINGLATTSTGEHRTYVSKGIQPGSAYLYQVRAEFVRDGKSVTEEKTVSLTGGQTSSVIFDAASEAQVAGTASPAQR